MVSSDPKETGLTAPSGTVTFLFTDIEGSTQLWESHPELMQTSLSRHDSLMRQAIKSHSGVVFKTIGDAFCAAFHSASDGLLAAFEAQQALIKEPWPEDTKIKVRMALHTGVAESRDNDYFGQTLNRVARLLSTCHGGQTVVSQTVSDLLNERLPAGLSLADLGEHRLKDIARPERIFQVNHESLPSIFAPLKSLGSAVPLTNLPEQITTFVGRENERAKVVSLLKSSRVVTMTGSGGCGKTRLAIQVATESMLQFPDGIWIAELAPLNDSTLIPQTIASILGVREEPGQSMTQTVVSHLLRKKLLLILDNCEHILLACAQFTEAIVRACPDVRILATSREALNIAGEATFRVPSLSLPDPRRDSDPQVLERFESVQLFSDRARAVQPSFVITQENARSLAHLCHQLDGIPLAIELAAARVRSISVEQIATRLDDRFRLLTGGSRTALPRQQTLRALVDWSYDLLSEQEKALLRRLSIFSGGWTLAAAETVTAGNEFEDWEVLDLLTSLVDKSLVIFESSRAEERYRLLETVRRYGREKLVELNEEAQTLDQHLQWYFQFSSEAGSWMRGPKQAEWLERFENEKDNLWLALESSRSRKAQLESGQLAWTLSVLLQYRGFLNEAVKAIEAGLEVFADPASTEILQLARLLYERAGLHQDFGESDEATQKALKSLTMFDDCGDVGGSARAENLLGQIEMSAYEFESASDRFESSLRLFEQTGDLSGVSIVRNNQGVLARRQASGTAEEKAAKLAQAEAFLTESLKIRRQLGDVMGEAETLNNLGVVAFEAQAFDSAWENYRGSLTIERELRRTPGIATALANLGEVAGIRGDQVLAIRLMAVSQRILEDIQSPLSGAVHSMLMDMAEGLAPNELRSIINEARAMPIEENIDTMVYAEARIPAQD